MKVAMLLHNTLDSFTHDIRVRKEAKALAEIGFEVCVIVYGKSNETIPIDNYIVEVIDIESILKKTNIYRKLSENQNIGFIDRLFKRIIDFIFDNKLKKFIVSNDFDVVHCHDYNTLHVGLIVKNSKASTKIIYDSHEFHAEYGSGHNALLKLQRYIISVNEKKLKKMIDMLIVVNDSMKRYFEVRYDYKKILIIQNIATIYNAHPQNDLRKKLNISDKTKLVIYEGCLVREKCIDLILEASKIVQDDIAFIFAGNGQLNNIEKSQKNVFQLGYLPHNVLYDYISQSDIGLCLIGNTNFSYYHSTPNKLWDYIMCGIPCIGSDFPNIKEIIVGNNVGRVIDPSNLNQLVQAIEELTEDNILNKLKENAKKLREAQNWEMEKIKLQRLYQEFRNTLKEGGHNENIIH